MHTKFIKLTVNNSIVKTKKEKLYLNPVFISSIETLSFDVMETPTNSIVTEVGGKTHYVEETVQQITKMISETERFYFDSEQPTNFNLL